MIKKITEKIKSLFKLLKRPKKKRRKDNYPMW